MQKKKIECENGWICFIVSKDQVIEVHSTGYTCDGIDDRGTGSDLLRELENDALHNRLHSQNRLGVRWPEDN
jgi:hypothetical protein